MTAGGGAASAGVAGGTAVLAPGTPPAAAPPASGRGRPRAARGADPGGGRDALPLWMRVGVWVVALPLGLAIVGIPARQAGYLSSQKLLDVIVKRDLSRFVPIIVIIALWALASAVLVTLLVEGGRRWMLSRRRGKARDRDGAVLDDSLDRGSDRRGLFRRRR